MYPVELGESFVSHHAFHTLKYDFKPKSIDYDSLGTLASDGRNIQVTLKVRLRLKEPPTRTLETFSTKFLDVLFILHSGLVHTRSDLVASNVLRCPITL